MLLLLWRCLRALKSIDLNDNAMEGVITFQTIQPYTLFGHEQESISPTFYWRNCANTLAQIQSLTFTASTTKLSAKVSYEKGARKMLVKLTPGQRSDRIKPSAWIKKRKFSRYLCENRNNWGQFHQRCTSSFYVHKLRTQLFCAYILALYSTGVRLLA